MATTTISTGPVLRPIRVFQNHYQCDDCPNEWTDEMLTVSHSWCPCCDAQMEPYASDELLADMLCDDEEVE